MTLWSAFWCWLICGELLFIYRTGLYRLQVK